MKDSLYAAWKVVPLSTACTRHVTLNVERGELAADVDVVSREGLVVLGVAELLDVVGPLVAGASMSTTVPRVTSSRHMPCSFGRWSATGPTRFCRAR